MPQTLFDEIREMKRRIRDLETRSPGPSSVSTDSMINVSQGGSINVQDDGRFRFYGSTDQAIVSLDTRGDNLAKPDGSNQPWIEVRRDDGSLAVQLGDVSPLDGTDREQSYQQLFQLFDQNQGIIFSEDGPTGFGMASPTIHYPLYRAAPSDGFSTSSSDFVVAYVGEVQSRSPFYTATMRYLTTSSGSGEMQMIIDDVLGEDPTPFTGSGSIDLSTDFTRIDDVPGYTHSIKILVRLVDGSGPVSVVPIASQGTGTIEQ